jgi:diaminopimelate epimerase
MRFTKMEGVGNDFVVLDERGGSYNLSAARTAALANRHTGVGCDQLISIAPADGADAFMHIHNPDGSKAGACGNATRCVADILMRESGRDSVTIRTIAGDLAASRQPDGMITVDMGSPNLDWTQIPLAQPLDTVRLDLAHGPVREPAAASMGNPHATFFVGELQGLPIETIGPELEHHPLFPERANIGFAQVIDPETIRLRMWERGAGVTLACGSGACAAVVNAHRRGLANRKARVILDGGTLWIEWHEDGRVLMTGPVATVFTGELDLDRFPP